MKKKVCMIVQDKMVKGGIAAVISGYYKSELEQEYKMIYVESYKDGGKFGKLLKGVKGYLHFAKVLLIDHPDLVHIHSSFGPSFYRKLPFIYMASFARIPIINHIHGADFNEFYINASKKKQHCVRKVYNKCSILIALSNEWKEKLSMIVSENKIAVVENYSILNFSAYEERKQREKKHLVLFLGELGKRKGCYDIPMVAEKVLRKIPDAEFVLGGAGTKEDEDAIKDLFIQKNIEKHVKFPGWVRGKEKDDLLRNSSVFFLPSYNEGMPMSILDAMGYGLPVVSTNVGGIPKIVKNGVNGSCIEPGDIDGLAEALIMILSDDKLMNKYIEGSFRIIEEKYSLETHIMHLKKLYDKVQKEDFENGRHDS